MLVALILSNELTTEHLRKSLPKPKPTPSRQRNEPHPSIIPSIVNHSGDVKLMEMVTAHYSPADGALVCNSSTYHRRPPSSVVFIRGPNTASKCGAAGALEPFADRRFANPFRASSLARRVVSTPHRKCKSFVWHYPAGCLRMVQCQRESWREVSN